MLNLIFPEAIKRHLQRFDRAFSNYRGELPRAFYHDSYEYVTDWSPGFFEDFRKRRGYDLKAYLREFFGNGNKELKARLKADYRRTVSELIEESLSLWVNWSHEKGVLTRNQAHGSPGNLLDLYSVADIPETEMFHNDRDELIAKFASSAAHVSGKRLVAAETGTWLKEHFHVKLSDLKDLVDQLFVSGVNHVFYHGTCYSPQDAPWPGWVFYASTQMNPRNSIWQDAELLNAYISRVQAVLQQARPDNEILLYWPIEDLWHDPDGMVIQLTVHNTRWFTEQSIGKVARFLWKRGYSFDYVSDKQLLKAECVAGMIRLPGGTWRLILVPPCRYMPEETFLKILDLAKGGASVGFFGKGPKEYPGVLGLKKGKEAISKKLSSLNWQRIGKLEAAKLGKGKLLRCESAEPILKHLKIPREPIVDFAGVYFVRVKDPQGYWYFLTNRSISLSKPVEVNGWVLFSRKFKYAALVDPVAGQRGSAWVKQTPEGTKVYMQLPPGGSLLLRTSSFPLEGLEKWKYFNPVTESVELKGPWHVRFLRGGPKLPRERVIPVLRSWTEWAGPEGERFAGTARYSIVFKVPDYKCSAWLLDLGRVEASCRVRLNGKEVAGLFAPPFRCVIRRELLKEGDNLLEVDVTNLSANRIRDLDRRGVKWKNFHDINFVNIRYRAFDASKWPVLPSGLLGPVKLTALELISW